MGEGARPEKEKICVKSAVRRFRCMPRRFSSVPALTRGNAYDMDRPHCTGRSLPFPMRNIRL